MKEICLPIHEISGEDRAEVVVHSSQTDKTWRYRIENFQLEPGVSVDVRINILRQRLSQYDPKWELIQILDTDEAHTHVHVLYRER